MFLNEPLENTTVVCKTSTSKSLINNIVLGQQHRKNFKNKN